MEGKSRIWRVIEHSLHFSILLYLKDNVFNNVPGVWKAKGDGFFVFLEPLSPGMHTLHTTVSVINPKQPNITMLQT